MSKSMVGCRIRRVMNEIAVAEGGSDELKSKLPGLGAPGVISVGS